MARRMRSPHDRARSALVQSFAPAKRGLRHEFRPPTPLQRNLPALSRSCSETCIAMSVTQTSATVLPPRATQRRRCPRCQAHMTVQYVAPARAASSIGHCGAPNAAPSRQRRLTPIRCSPMRCAGSAAESSCHHNDLSGDGPPRVADPRGFRAMPSWRDAGGSQAARVLFERGPRPAAGLDGGRPLAPQQPVRQRNSHHIRCKPTNLRGGRLGRVRLPRIAAESRNSAK